MRTLLARIKGSALLRDTGLYTVFNVLDRAIPFLLLPVVTRYLSPTEFGLYVTFQALTLFLMPFVTMNADAAIVRKYFERETVPFPRYFTAGIVVFMTSSLLMFAVMLPASQFLSGPLNFPPGWLLATVLICSLQFGSDLMLNLLQARKKPVVFGWYRISLTLLRNSAMLYFVMVLGWKWEGIVLSQVIVFGLFFGISAIHFLRNGYLLRSVDRTFVVDAVRYGAPLTMHRIGAWLSDLASRLILTSLLGAAATGTYGIAASLGMVVALLQDSFNRAFVPYLFDRLNGIDDDGRRRLVRLTYLYNAGLLLTTFLIAAGGMLAIPMVFGEAYAAASGYIPWICLGYAFDGMYKMHVNYIFYSNRTQWIFPVTVTSGVVNIALCYWLIPDHGAVGAAEALCGALGVSYVLAWVIGQRVHPMPWFGGSAAAGRVR